ncbi:vWA domain-containing protein [Methyloferula stellata]|uniref:vWA domain-containing protein n=1 Tax=Methyloferula stellata TaxID=876270 RepID=UPI0003632AF0|nr:vWA domain-containing protein [Methyloferula stellata]
MNIWFAEPKWLWLLPLALCPIVTTAMRLTAFPSFDAVPDDFLSRCLEFVLRLAAAFAIASAVIGLAQPYRLGQSLKRIGQGAHVVIVMDRSTSMDFTLADDQAKEGQESKTQIAGRLLRQFVDQSKYDQFGVVAFSTAPVFVLPISDHRDAVKAAVNGLMRPGIEGTNVGLGIQLALRMIAEDGTASSPAVLLVSDGEYGGAGFFEHKLQEDLKEAFRKQNAHLYWLFLRAQGAEKVFDPPPAGQEDSPHTKPERHMDLFFKSLGVTYRVFQADSPQAIEDAMAEINHLETRPITYFEHVPRKDISALAYLVAGFASIILVLSKLAETGFVQLRFRRQEAVRS